MHEQDVEAPVEPTEPNPEQPVLPTEPGVPEPEAPQPDEEGEQEDVGNPEE